MRHPVSYMGLLANCRMHTITTRFNQKSFMTAEVRALLKTRDSAFRTGDKAALTTARSKLSRPSERQNVCTPRESTLTSQTAETHGICGRASRPSLTTSNTTCLWQWCLPPRCAEPLLRTLFGPEQHGGKEDHQPSQWPCTASFHEWCEENSAQS